MRILLSICALVTISLAASSPDEIDFCDVEDEHCNGDPHIACQPDKFTTSGLSTNVQPVELSQAQIDSLVTAHNNYRDQLAAGKFSNLSFPAASKLSEMTWDNTLAHVANIHCSYGEMKHDECRATPEFPDSGQNLFQWLSSADNINIDTIIQRAVTAWFEEINDADPALVKDLQWDDIGVAGHFTVMVNDKNNHLGCGLSRFNYPYNGRKWFGVLLTCNYGYTNIIGQSVYRSGASGSMCTRGTSKKFKNLCAREGSTSSSNTATRATTTTKATTTTTTTTKKPTAAISCE